MNEILEEIRQHELREQAEKYYFLIKKFKTILICNV